ncbi:hypothetical protein CIG75_15530 [Tumebacillus algifaecis]|uniref:Rho termination factor N-terminal domain-containing protein n=1 Tax=Tumebacillus algifaecis TaxID=1214604 RepID=A0A223D3L4_9BACL|nr:hypothetical protein [Tumebacillus algifaecis]ASS76212.1 hypothetical protein CIG75_15530 [Tumebacillus algifaecis]
MSVDVEELDSMGVKEIQALAKQLRIHPSYKVGGLRVRKNKAELLRDIRRQVVSNGSTDAQ